MAGPKQDPFGLWLAQQREHEPLPATSPTVELSPEREAIRALKIDELLDARDDEERFQQLSYEVVDLNRRLYLEQIADDALTPTDAQARGLVLNIAAAILQDLRPTGGTPAVDTLADTAIAVLNATARRLEAA